MTQSSTSPASQVRRDVNLSELESKATSTAIDRPVIIVSAGRSGSTVFHDLLAHHFEACWLPRGCDVRPGSLSRFRLLFHAVDLPVIGDLSRRRFQPVEGYGFWDHHYPGFSGSFRDLRAEDVTPTSRERIRSALSDLITERRPRLILKITGWPRAGFLKEIFPSARFIHLLRDGRPVAASLLKVPWWRGWEGPDNWRFGPLSPDENRIWENHDCSFVALAGLQWSRTMEAMERSRALLESDGGWHTIRYEDLCRDPESVFEEALEYSELPATPNFLRSVGDYGFENRNSKWRRHLTKQQQATLERVVSEKLDKFDYV